MFEKQITETIQESIYVKELILQDADLIRKIYDVSSCMIQSIKSGGKILICGNGGSACDAQHIAGELVCRFQCERPAYPAIALSSDIAAITAVANDYDYDRVFARQVEAYAGDKDVLIGLSTSGNSQNIIQAFRTANKLHCKTVLMTGATGGEAYKLADHSIRVPSNVTARIQEAHECIYHIICGIVEAELSK